MVDLQETPAVPPEATGGDERAGMIAAGATLIALGWGLGVLANLFLHLSAPSGGARLGPVFVFDHLGPFAWATLLIGLMTGTIGAGVIAAARSLPTGPLVLPGQPY